MSVLGDVVGGLAYAGVGAAIGSIVAAAISARSGKGEARAHAADLITDAAGALADKQAATIDRLEKRADKQAKAIITLTSVVDELLDQLKLPTSEKQKLQQAVNEARLAIY